MCTKEQFKRVYQYCCEHNRSYIAEQIHERFPESKIPRIDLSRNFPRESPYDWVAYLSIETFEWFYNHQAITLADAFVKSYNHNNFILLNHLTSRYHTYISKLKDDKFSCWWLLNINTYETNNILFCIRWLKTYFPLKYIDNFVKSDYFVNDYFIFRYESS